MLTGWGAVFGAVAENIWTAAAILLTLVGAAVAAFARREIGAGTNWALRPIARRLPWHRDNDKTRAPTALSSVFTLIQVFLLDVDGNHARYEKTTCFVVNRSTTSYQEAVTAEHAAEGFSTMRGMIVETAVERGFYVSRIDLGNAVQEGERLTNIYSAYLLNSFAKRHEHWTQEFAYPTERLTLQVHFPAERPPKSVACMILDGASMMPATSPARLIDLFGRKSIVWEVTNPKLHQAVKLEWIW